MKKTLYFATGNKNKFEEVRAILKDFDLKQAKVDLPELQGNPEDVAKEKARIAFDLVKKPVFVDDTGLAFNALNGMPGIYIKHFLESIGLDGLRKLLFGFKDKSAVAYASIGYCDGKKTKVFIGFCEGKIVKVQDKAKSFGWDGIFKPDGYCMTFASMPKAVKNKISHRRKALESFRKFLVR